MPQEVERLSADQRISGSIPDPCSQCGEVSLHKILNTEIAPRGIAISVWEYVGMISTPDEQVAPEMVISAPSM